MRCRLGGFQIQKKIGGSTRGNLERLTDDEAPLSKTKPRPGNSLIRLESPAAEALAGAWRA
jgi:hypothetical protein